jgi:hypothetical protein
MKHVTKNRIVLLLALLAGNLFAGNPQWWITRGVVDTNTTPRDFAPVNQGQVKQIAYKAYLEFQEKLGGASPAVSNLIAGFSTTNNYLPANLGQLKHLAKPFYEQLIAEGYAPDFPWAGLLAKDHAIANQGQLKNLFSFDLDAFDSDSDGLPDWREKLDGLNPNNPDSDGDGYSDYDELLVYRTNPGNGDVLPPTVSIVTPVSSIIFVP